MGELERLAIQRAARDAAWPKLCHVTVNTQTGEIADVTEPAAALFGYTSDELHGQSVEILVPELIRPQHATWRQDAKAPETRLMGVGREVSGQRKDGSLIRVHVGLTIYPCLERMFATAVIIDTTGIQLTRTVEVKP